METIGHNLDALAAFHAVALDKSFSRAAESLGTSKAMVSKQVKRLEAHLKLQLFLRTTRSVSLTEEGAALFAYSRRIFELSSEAGKKLRTLSQGSSGTIKLAAPVSLGEAFFPEILAELREALPQVSVEIDLSNDNLDFAKDGIDFAVRATDDHAPDLIARRLGRIRDMICVSPAFLRNFSPMLTEPRGLVRCECLLTSLNPAWNTWTFIKGSEDVIIEAKGRYSSNQYPMARVLCLQGLGVARLPYYLVSDDLDSGRLVRLFGDYQISTHPLYLVYLRSEYATRKKKLIRDTILGWARRNRSFFQQEAITGG